MTKAGRINIDGQPETPRTRAKRKKSKAAAKVKAAAKAKAAAKKKKTEDANTGANPTAQEVAKASVDSTQKENAKQNKTNKINPFDAGIFYTTDDDESTDENQEGNESDEDNGEDEDHQTGKQVDDLSDCDGEDDLESNRRRIIQEFGEEARRIREAELNLSAQKGAKDPSNPVLGGNRSLSASALTEGEDSIEIREEKHVSQRIVLFVKSDIFRTIKFVNSEDMFRRAFEKVLKIEKVHPAKRLRFRLTYEKCFIKALNNKRSACEQSGSKIAKTEIAEFKKRGEVFFTIEEFCKLRRATTEREKQAFYWFFGSFLECVSGARTWGTAKNNHLVSAARGTDNCRIVTKTDEAFGLLLIDNYLEKWKQRVATEEEEEIAGGEPVENRGLTVVEDSGGTTTNKKRTKRLPGKYTVKSKSGACKFSGWSPVGMARFNELHNIVKEDRACVQCEVMERELLAFCRNKAGMKSDGDQQEGTAGDGVNAIDTVQAMVAVEAAWDSDNDY